MRLRGVHHVEINAIDYESSIEFYDRMFGWLGYSSFSTLGIEFVGTYYHAFPHSYIGIQPAKSGDPLDFDEWRPGINHIALHAKNRKEVNKFYEQFLLKEKVAVLNPPQEYMYTPGYYAVFFFDPSGIKWELAGNTNSENKIVLFQITRWPSRILFLPDLPFLPESMGNLQHALLHSRWE